MQGKLKIDSLNLRIKFQFTANLCTTLAAEHESYSPTQYSISVEVYNEKD